MAPKTIENRCGFMERSVAQQCPFYAFASLTQPHFPTLPHPDFVGRTGHGDWSDMLAELDHNAGAMLDAVDRLGVRDDTIVIFTSDNGAEFLKAWDGWSGPWRGQYFTALEGGIRVPFLLRRPGRVPAGRVSDEIVHGVDLFTTLAGAAGAAIPQDRPIDGRDQWDSFCARSERSAREGVLIWVDNRLQAAKWHNFKVHFWEQDSMVSPPVKLPVPLLLDLYANPREEPDKRAFAAWVTRSCAWCASSSTARRSIR
jgi:arylsulfatase A-like enzyme